MAYTTIIFKNPYTGSMKEAPVGFSWTVFFFGFFPALFRGDFKWFAIILILAFCTFGFSNLVFMFMYNKLHIRDLIGAGYKAVSIGSGDMNTASANVGMQIPTVDAA